MTGETATKASGEAQEATQLPQEFLQELIAIKPFSPEVTETALAQLPATELLSRCGQIQTARQELYYRIDRAFSNRLQGFFKEKDKGAANALIDQWNGVRDKTGEGLKELGIDISSADFGIICEALLRGRPPVQVRGSDFDIDAHRDEQGVLQFAKEKVTTDEQNGLNFLTIFRNLSLDSSSIRVVSTVRGASSGDDAELRQATTTMFGLLEDGGRIHQGDNPGEQFAIVQENDLFSEAASKMFETLGQSGKGRIEERNGLLAFFPTNEVLEAAGLFDTPEGAKLQSAGIVLSNNGWLNGAALDACHIMLSDSGNTIHLAVLGTDGVQRRNETTALISALGGDADRYHAVIIDPEKSDPLVAAFAVETQIQRTLDARTKELLVLGIEEGGRLDEQENPLYVAGLVMEGFDQISDERALELLPEILEVYKSGNSVGENHDLKLERFAAKLIDRFGERLLSDSALDTTWKHPNMFRMFAQNFVSWREENRATIDEALARSKDVGLDAWPPEIDLRRQLLMKAFEGVGFDSKTTMQLFNSWNSLDQENGRKIEKRRHIETIAMLEAAEAGSARAIYDTFFIRHFARYIPGSLLQQLRDYREGTVPDYFTLVLSSNHDWNGALRNFSRNLDRNEISTSQESSREMMVFAEVGSLAQLARQLIRMSKHFKPIDRLLVQAHGSSDHLRLGLDRGELLTREMIEQSDGAASLRRKSILSENGQVILKSCSTGKEGGVAQAIAKKVGVEVIAPPKNSGLRTEVRQKRVFGRSFGRKKHFVRFTASKDEKEEKIRANIYDSTGKKQRSQHRIRF